MSTEDAPAPKPSRAGRLLALVHSLIEYGTRIAAGLRQYGVTTLSRESAFPFGTTDIALILARIARGLLRAEALEARLTRHAARLDAEPPPPRASEHRKITRTHAAAAAHPSYTNDPGLADLPTAEQISAVGLSVAVA